MLLFINSKKEKKEDPFKNYRNISEKKSPGVQFHCFNLMLFFVFVFLIYKIKINKYTPVFLIRILKKFPQSHPMVLTLGF